MSTGNPGPSGPGEVKDGRISIPVENLVMSIGDDGLLPGVDGSGDIAFSYDAETGRLLMIYLADPVKDDFESATYVFELVGEWK